VYDLSKGFTKRCIERKYLELFCSSRAFGPLTVGPSALGTVGPSALGTVGPSALAVGTP
jgi:hypothetical protein